MENLTNELKRFGSMILASHNKDAEAAATTLTKLNNLIEQHPDIVRMIAEGNIIEKAIKISQNKSLMGLMSKM